MMHAQTKAFNKTASEVAEYLDVKRSACRALGNHAAITFDEGTCAGLAGLLRSYVAVTEAADDLIEMKQRHIDSLIKERKAFEELEIAFKGANFFAMFAVWRRLRRDRK